MAWRFKASKYKNAAPIVPKPEVCIRDIVVGSYQTYGNNIAASAAFMAFNWEHAGSSLAVLPLDDCGRKSKNMPLLHGHTDTVTDLHFSPFHDGLLATGSQDCLVKIWHIPEKGLEQSLTTPECQFTHKQRRVETVGFHPTADYLLHSTAAGNINLWDLTSQKEVFGSNEHPDVIQSLNWKLDGTLMTTSCKDKMVRIIDPRSNVPITLAADSHQSIKDSRVVWLGDQSRILTTGFDSARLRQIIIRDLRNFNTPEKTLELDCSTGVLMPLYDPDTNMLFLAGKGDTTIAYMEVTDKDPYLIEGLRHNGEQTKGACLVPKRALRVMEGEVNRIMQLTSNSVIPIMYQVPRKTYRDFHSDLYPETNGYKTDLTVTQWLKGVNTPVSKMSLDPAKRELGDAPIIVHRGTLHEMIKNDANKCAKQIEIKPPSTLTASASSVNRQQSNDNVDNRHATSISNRPLNKYSEVQQPDDYDNDAGKPLSKMDLIKKFDSKYKQSESIDNKQQQRASFHEESQKTNVIPDEVENDENIQNSNNEEISDVESARDAESTSVANNNYKNGNITCGSNANANGNDIVPPKPLPRTSRNNSVSSLSSEHSVSISSNPIEESNVRPIAKPRTTTTTSYKPRLGPKPFSVGSGDVNFDKVFSVPQAPGSERNSTSSNHNEAISTTDNQNKSTESSDNSIDEQKDSDEKEGTEEEKNAIVYRNGSNGHSMHKSDSLEEDLQRAISTAERRKIFENARSESEIASHDSTDAEELRRLTLNRSSIAERRRLYEARSVSTNNAEDKPPQSPLPVLRKDSTKTRSASPNKAQIEIEERRKTSPIPINESNGKHEDKTDAIFRKPNPVNNGNHGANNKTKPAEITTATKRTSTVFGKVSKFRHLKGTPTHKSTHIENIRNISRQIPGECNGFHANYKRVAVPLSGPGGKIAVYELNKPGRLPDGVIPSLVNGNSIMDFQWDPFDANKLAVACDDGVVRLWKVPDNGLTEPTNQPEGELVAHSDKIYFIRFHPLAKDVLLTASYDMTIKIWNLATFSEELCLKGHTDQIFDCAWSPCGVFAATVCKDGKIRIFNPRKSENPIREGPGPIGTRGARITWAIDGHYIVCTGFDKVSERQISIYKATDLSAPINTVGLDVSPAILIPFYDEDSSTLLLTGKGDSTIYAFEITDEAPHICPLSHHRCATSHQGLSFLTKNHCDVSAVEFAKAFRLTNNTIEPLSFTVPRIKNELFQDDLFPPTRVTWIPTLSPADWFNCRDKKVKKISLQPEGMECLSSTLPVTQQPPLTPNKKTDQHSPPSNILQSYNRQINTDNDKYKQEEIQKSVSARMEYTTSLEQDNMEGVDADEWNE
ncbi:coronin-7 isoform X7 [Sitodiplosis mosellana]|uniref:coronin-7 isoform X7 n=1 Tax=Sitodiplosis mosellana TaxID=263140 RepID=UPI0024451775|nr:coronin-7 isoform X7 [Sitodiplosis mosellana]